MGARPGLRRLVSAVSASPRPRTRTHVCVFEHEFSCVIMHAYEWALGTGEREFGVCARVHVHECDVSVHVSVRLVPDELRI